MLDDVRVVAFDIFGTVVDWHTGITSQVGEVFARLRIDLDPAAFADAWRDRYLPAMARVNNAEREWVYLDTLHRESLDALLSEHRVADAVSESDRAHLVRAWHRLPAWPDSAELLTRLRSRYLVVALSNGGFALLVNLVKHAGLTFDAIASAELAGRYKPDPAPYQTTARLLDVAPHEVLMVAAHSWDLDGARAAGLRTAFLERPAEKGPDREADRAADAVCDLAATSASDLAARLGCGN
ncbi:haloacid dehalogenase type II [Amycolatopsis benzoatilytica]|uniref:haloacid dehalogenase type II n=1 Tax=Amycolatopsis benzoatilytica TaxID=346045 RepID=UPI00037268FB|nr:haloacid dehalogenase type II [Amycolatopsis benzoatilytica]